jgi:hypothetical protein
VFDTNDPKVKAMELRRCGLRPDVENADNSDATESEGEE